MTGDTAEDMAGADVEEAVSPRQKSTTMEQAIQSLRGDMVSIDPDAQATVTDFLDFTEYLPADMMRSLTLIGKLDQTYADASTKVHNLTYKWGNLPSLVPEERLPPVQLRAEISENLSQAVSSRVFSHAEAVRLADNVNRHYNRARTILTKLQTMLQNYPTAEELKSPTMTARSPQVSRAPKITLRVEGGAHKTRRQRVPRITVPGEVLAPYELNYETLSDDSESSSEDDEEMEEEDDDGDDDDEEDDEDESVSPTTATPAPQARIKLVKNAKPPKPPKVYKSGSAVPAPYMPTPSNTLSTSVALSQLQPPPENAVIGSSDAPWLQLTNYELAKLRKRMKKNASWAPSDTMIARELKNLGRGLDAFTAAKQKAEDEGRIFEGTVPAPVMDESGTEHMPPGALSMEALAEEEKNLNNRGVKLNEAKKLKREQLAKLAAEEAEESARKLREAARAMFLAPQTALQEQQRSASKAKQQPPKKRKRDSIAETEAEKPELIETPVQRPLIKRTKTETPVPLPHLNLEPSSHITREKSNPPPQSTPSGPAAVPHSTTPIPVPIPGHDASIIAASRSTTSPASSSSVLSNAVTITTIPLKPAAETYIPPPIHSPKKSTTPILPPVRETRKMQANRLQDPLPQQPDLQQKDGAAPTLGLRSSSRAVTPVPVTPKIEQTEAPSSIISIATSNGTGGRRPASRGKAASQEPQPSLAADRPRRASTARNTPAPERAEPARPSSRRAKRPAPGIISRTNSGGNSAVGKRKTAPKKKAARGAAAAAAVAAANKKGADAGGPGDLPEVEVDDEGNVIDPDEPKYCLCNRVSFGTMIQCDNMDNCKQEWFHLECVGLSDVPARTTKWYCPECRVLLNIGEKGEVNARGVKM